MRILESEFDFGHMAKNLKNDKIFWVFEICPTQQAGLVLPEPAEICKDNL